MPLFVGTSGWSYPDWQPAFYPPGLTTGEFLRHYASILTACEVNATHYRLPASETVAGWARSVPDDFRFAVKAHRRLTDGRAMAWGPAEVAFLARFLGALEPLGARLGAVLLQFADDHRRDDGALQSVLDALPTDTAFVIELRHDSWQDPSVDDRIAAAGVVRCLTETHGTAPPGLPDGSIAYVRLRADHYGQVAQAAWRSLLAEEAARRPVWAIARHEGLPPDDPDAGLGLALGLMPPRANT